MTPGLARRLASLVYEALTAFALAFFAGALFLVLSGARDATQGTLRHALQFCVALALGCYFLFCWLRGGQTLAMKAWRIRLVEVTPRKALLRLLLAAALLPLSVVWALFDRDRQFLHDRLAGTRLIYVPPTTSSRPPPQETPR
ncbi:MAG TPA: RDD family protein [Burkholderiales bacterium]|nr:RDD family protein [Burkholderiales bacterium]